MMATQLGRRDKEGARDRDLLVKSAHRGIERLDAHTNCFAPSGDLHLAQIPFGIESRQPIDAMHGSGDHPVLHEFTQRLCR